MHVSPEPEKSCSMYSSDMFVCCLRSVEETAPPYEPVSDTARLHPVCSPPEQATMMTVMMVLFLVIPKSKQYSYISICLL